MFMERAMGIFKNGKEWTCQRCFAQFEIPTPSTSRRCSGEVVGSEN
jgi:hypothetical protein